jgi:hypothetical protein
MATKKENIDIETMHLKHCMLHVTGWDDCHEPTVDFLTRSGFIQVSTVYEHALASIGNHTVLSEDTHDLNDGSDAKLSTVRTSSYGTAYSAPVGNINNKIGALRVQVYERKQNKFYYFVIPHSAHSQVSKSSNIEIPFELDGSPRRTPKGPTKLPNWWEFEVLNFYELATK